jgi:HAE1 family hydrophobic/amphiphilic exporter-1
MMWLPLITAEDHSPLPPIPTSTPLSAESAATMARNIAPEVAAARIGQAIAAVNSRSAYAFAYPHVLGSASYTRSSLDYQEIPVFGNVAFNREEEYRTGVALEQYLYSYGRLGAASDADSQLTRLAKHEVVLTQRDMAFMARVTFESARLARARQRIAAERVAQRTGERNDAHALAQAGRANMSEANLADIILSQAEDERAAADSEWEKALIKLAALIGVERAAMPEIAAEPIDRPDLPKLLSTAAQMVKSGGEPVSFELQQQYEDALGRLERSTARPQLYARASYGADGTTYDNLDDAWSASLALTWKLYDGGNTSANSERAVQRSRQLRYQREASVRDRLIQLDQARHESRSLQERITLADHVIILAKANYEDTRAQYRTGRLTLVQVGDSSFRLTEAYYRLLSLRYQESVLGHELERLAE